MNATKLNQLVQAVAQGRTLLSVRGTAMDYGVSSRCVRYWLQEAGKKVFTKKIHGRKFVDQDALTAWHIVKESAKQTAQRKK
jgi:hypothetical protein